MGEFWWGYWWLIFPVGWMIFGAWDRWLRYQRSRHALEVMKTFAAQGKDPPPELVTQVRDDAYGHDGYRGRHWRSRRNWRAGGPPDATNGVDEHQWNGGAHREWRSAVIIGAVAAGFWIASEYSYMPRADGPFRFVAIILTCVAAANLIFALISTRFRDR